jgi:Tol biopolymer transport system component/DNA-binding winged helix-turn-helix (wHTH) protein
MESSKPVRFGPFELKPETGELRKHGVLLNLQDQPAKLLVALLERPGEVVSRAELVKLLWPDGTFVDFDRGLNAAVTRLRQALSDSAESPRYVETVARRGYRFIGSVEAAGASPNDTHCVEPGPPVPLERRRWIFITGAFAVAAIIGAVWLRRSERPSVPPSGPVPLTTLDGIETEPSFSPDATQVAFAWNGATQDNFDIYVKVVGIGVPVRLTSDPAPDRRPVWSPDGRYVAFIRQGRGLFIVPPAGGTERQIGDAAAAALAWSPDGKHLIFASTGVEPLETGIHAVAVDGGELRRLLAVPKPRRVDALALSPDGRRLAYSSCYGFKCELMSGEVDGQLNLRGQPMRLADRPGGINAIAWTADSRSLILSEWEGLGLGSGLRLTRVGLDRPEEVQPLPFGGQNAAAGALSGSGSKLVYSQVQHNTDIWQIEGGEASRSPVSSTLNDESPQFSPDGKRVVFSSHRSGRQEVWVANVDGSQPQQLTSSIASGTPRWSPDGKWIAYDTLTVDSEWDIAVIPAAGGAPKRIVSHSASDFSPSF